MKKIPIRKTKMTPTERTFGIPPKESDIPKVFKKSDIGGRKPKNWEKKKSKYRVSIKTAYVAVFSRVKKPVAGFLHYLTITATFNKTKGNKHLEGEVMSRLNSKLPEWKQKEIKKLSAEIPEADAIYYYPEGSSWKIRRVA